jgi:tripartite-type tricarboxylate transporter receptor subunit TctC
MQYAVVDIKTGDDMLGGIARYVRPTLAALLFIPCLGAFGQAYPNQTLTIVVSYGPGGAGDLTARVFAQKMTQLTKASVVILNRPGAGFVNSATMVAHAKPDGYTAFLLGNGAAVATQLFKSLPYKMSDFKHASTISFFDLALLVNSDSLRSVLDPFLPAAGSLQALWPPTRHESPKVRAFVDFMVRKLLAERA